MNRSHADPTLPLLILLVLLLAACDDRSDTPIPVEPDGGIGIGAAPLPVTAAHGHAALRVTIDSPDRETVSYDIDCTDTEATVEGPVAIDPARACAALADPDVRRRLIEGAPAGRMCTMVYGGPEEARIRGNIDGLAVETIVRRNDGCGINDWDNLLRDLLVDAPGDAR